MPTYVPGLLAYIARTAERKRAGGIIVRRGMHDHGSRGEKYVVGKKKKKKKKKKKCVQAHTPPNLNRHSRVLTLLFMQALIPAHSNYVVKHADR
jgi:hypothetical protein